MQESIYLKNNRINIEISLNTDLLINKENKICKKNKIKTKTMSNVRFTPPSLLNTTNLRYNTRLCCDDW